jgi:RNase P subunit RPR2
VNNEPADIIEGEFFCPRCNSQLGEKRPNDRHVVRNKELTVRLNCKCGYYRDITVNKKDFKD